MAMALRGFTARSTKGMTAGNGSPAKRRSPRLDAPPPVSGFVLESAPAELDRAALLSALAISGEAVMICSCATTPPRIIYVNPSFERLSGYSADDVCGQPYDFQLLQSSSEDCVREAIRTGKEVTAAFRFIHRTGVELQIELAAAPTPDAVGKTSYYVMALRDLEQTQRHVEHLQFIANHDSLTGLPNRRLLLDRIDQALARYRRSGETFALAFVDLNELKYVNDRFGHTIGDELLKHVSRCLAASIRSCDTVARYGGDEFVLLLSTSSNSDTASHIVARALRSLDQEFTIDGQRFKPTCSIGVAVCPRDGTDASTVLHAADVAMYRAKSTDRTLSSVHGL